MKTRENFGKAQGAAITMDESQDRPISTNGGIDPYGPFDRSTSSVAPERAAVPQSDPSNFNYDTHEHASDHSDPRWPNASIH